MSEETNFDMDIRIIILGVSSVGKTCLLVKYFDDKFYESSISSIGIDYKTKFFKFDGLKVKVNYLDTAGQERFQAISANYLKYANGIVFVYSIDSKASLHKIEEWMKEIDKKKVAFVIVGNKCDLEKEKREVDLQEGEEFAKKYECPFYEVSAKSGVNVNKVFDEIGFMTYEKMEKESANKKKGAKLGKGNKKEIGKCCKK